MNSIYANICKKMLLPLGDIATQQRVMQLHRFYRESQWWDRERLIDYQNKQLQETLKIAYHEVHFYQELYDRYNVKLSNIRTVDDLPLLPIATKEMLKAAYPKYCTRKTKWPSQEYSTSGSSGKPFAVRVDNLTMSHARALMFMRANFSGWKIGDPFLQTGMTLNRGFVKRMKDLFLRTQYVSAFNLSNEILDGYLGIIESKKLAFIMGYPGSVYCLALRASEVGMSPRMKGIVTWGDNVYKHYRSIIERQFQCQVTDTYGCGEGIQVAAQCGLNNGIYHIFMPHVAVEIIDDGQPVTPGKTGDIILTRLDAGVMPLIRYQIGDIGSKSHLKDCPCGRELEMMESIEGRDTDIIITPNGNKLIVHFFTGIFEYYHSVDTFRVLQEKMGEITIEIVPQPDFKNEHWEKIKQEILSKGDPDLKLHLNVVSEIPIGPSNKRRFVISRLANSYNSLNRSNANNN